MADSDQQASEYYTRYLNELLNKHREIQDYETLGTFLPQFFDYISSRGFFSVQVAETSSYCVVCYQGITVYEWAYTLGCLRNHAVCSWECLKTLIVSYSQREVEIGNMNCPQCKSAISPELCGKVLSYLQDQENEGSEILAEEGKPQAVKKSEIKEQSKFTCDICYMDGVVEKELTLDCKHCYHKECIKEMFEFAINERKVKETDLACPMCTRPISHKILHDLAGSNRISVYDEIAATQAIPELAEANEQVS